MFQHYTSKERDAESGYDYFGARYYDARIGRFLSVDRFAATEPSLSPYQYVGGNPMRFFDSNGDTIVQYGQDRAGSLGDLQEFVGQSDASRLTFAENGSLVIDQKDYVGGTNLNMDLLITMNNATQVMGYGVTDNGNALTLDANGNVYEGAIYNWSKTDRNLDIPGSHSNFDPLPEGFRGSGLTKIDKGIRFLRGNKEVERREIVGHELKEQYARTVWGLNYRVAHAIANLMYFGGISETDPITIRRK